MAIFICRRSLSYNKEQDKQMFCKTCFVNKNTLLEIYWAFLKHNKVMALELSDFFLLYET